MVYFRFFKLPILFLAIFFATGIFFVNQCQGYLWCLLFPFIVPLVLFFLKRKGAVFFFAIASFLYLGGFMQSFLISQESVLSKYQHRQVTIIGTVDEIASESKIWRKSICSVNQLIVGEKKHTMKNRVLLYFNVDDIRQGDQLMISTQIQKIKNKGNPGEFDAETYWGNKGIQFMGFVSEEGIAYLDYFEPNKFQKWRNSVIESIENTLRKATQNHPESFGVASALILGDKSELNPAIKDSFQSAGAMHVLAVSGLHIGILLTVLIFFFRQFSRWINQTKATLIALIIIWLYAFLINFPPSVIRASLLFSIVFIGKVINAQPNNLNTLSFAFIVMLMIQPRWLFDIGFQLSFLAMIGIYTLYPIVSKWIFIRNKWIRKIWEGTAVGISAQLFTFPLTLYYFHQFPNYFILTNIGMMFFAFVVLLLGFLLLTFQWIPFIRIAIAFFFSLMISGMILFVEKISSLPAAIATGFKLNFFHVLLLYLLLILFLLFRKNKKIKNGIYLSFALLFIWIQFGRFEQMNKNELVIFNTDFPMFSIKNGTKITVFHPDEKLKKAERIISGYETVTGAKATLYPTTFTKARFTNGNQIEKMDSGFLITFNQKKYFFRTELMHESPHNCQIIDLGKNKLSDSHFSLEDQSLIFQ